MTLSLRAASCFALVLLTLCTAIARGQTAPPDEAAQAEFFEKKIRPLLVGSCYTCHSANTNSKGGLRVDDRNGLLNGGGRGSAVVPGKPDESLLLRAVRQTDDKLKMPPEKKLSDEEIADLTQWIEHGAYWPPESTWSPGEPNEEYERLRKEHWAWQPLHETTPPVVRDINWPLGDIDRYLLAGLETRGLQPVGDATKQDLIRRVTFDLTGLPPSPKDVAAFLADESPQAYEQLVNRLLDAPAFGERWGRHWLDVARYGESTGSARNLPYPHAWRYRDYVLRAFNTDKPYDQFLTEQIAGDLLPATTQAERDEHLVATGFLALGVKDVNQRFKVRFIMDNIDEQIDTVTRSALALTASCARCHDHKFDPIPQSDYYALAGIFHSTDLCAGLRNKMGGGGLDYYDTALLLKLGPENVASNPELAAKREAKQQELAPAQEELKVQQAVEKPDEEARKKLVAARQKVNQIKAEIIALDDPALQGPVALGVRDSSAITDTQLRIRGEAERHGPTIPRGFLSLVNLAETPLVPANQSGRLELARWLTSPQNPLTPRVMANRIWKHLFGQGLVRSVDNFGVTGDTPSHPELLDHLAARFVREGWSVKSLIRTVVLSRAYRLASDAPASHKAADPENRLVWRHSPRRLDAEEIRDAMLFAAGVLDTTPLDGSAAKDFKVIELRNNGPEAKSLFDAAATSTRRSVYLPLMRTLTPTSLEVFDFAEQGMVTGSRSTTTVAPQALYLLNDPFVREQSQRLAQKLIAEPNLQDADRVIQVYELILGRGPRTDEIAKIGAYLADYVAAAEQIAPPNVAQAAAETESRPNVSNAGDSGSVAKTEANLRIPPAPALPEDPAPKSKKKSKQKQETENTVAAAKPLPPREAAWASFCQALFGSVEFRYLK